MTGLLILLMGLASAERPLTYSEAIDAALESNPALVSARVSVDQAEAGLLRSKGIFDPSLSVGTSLFANQTRGFFQGFPFEATNFNLGANASLGGSTMTGTRYALSTSFTRNNNEFTTSLGGVENRSIQDEYRADISASITQAILEGHRLSYNLQAVTRARSNLDIAQLSELNAVQNAIAQTASAYWNWYNAVELARIARTSEKLAEEALRIATSKVAAGDLAEVERMRLEAALMRSRSSALGSANNARRSEDALALLMGLPPGQGFTPAETIDSVPALNLDVEETTERALAQNLDLALARARLDQAALEVVNARHAMMPTLSITATPGVEFQTQRNRVGEDGEAAVVGPNAYPRLSVSSQLSVPLGNRAARGLRDSAIASEHSQKLVVEELERSIRQQVAVRVRALNSASRQVELARMNLELAEKTLASDEARQDAGRAIPRDVLRSRNELERAKVDLAKALADFKVGLIELRKLQGSLRL